MPEPLGYRGHEIEHPTSFDTEYRCVNCGRTWNMNEPDVHSLLELGVCTTQPIGTKVDVTCLGDRVRTIIKV